MRARTVTVMFKSHYKSEWFALKWLETHVKRSETDLVQFGSLD